MKMQVAFHRRECQRRQLLLPITTVARPPASSLSTLSRVIVMSSACSRVACVLLNAARSR